MSDTQTDGDKWTEKIVALPIAEFVDGNTLRFVRHLDAPPARVWEVLNTHAGWPWVKAIRADLRVGGAFELDFDDTNGMRGRIIELEPQKRIALEWSEASVDQSGAEAQPNAQSILSFDLEPEGTGTKLTLTHRHVTGEEAAGFGAGWHAHLGRLELYLSGEDADPPSLYGRLFPSYQRLVSEAR